MKKLDKEEIKDVAEQIIKSFLNIQAKTNSQHNEKEPPKACVTTNEELEIAKNMRHFM